MRKLIAVLMIATLGGCALGAAKYKVASGQERPAFGGEVLVFNRTVPASVSYKVIGTFHLQNRWYGSTTQEASYSANGAAAKRANGILIERTGHRLTAYSYAAPYTDGKLLWIENYEQAKAPYLKPGETPAKPTVENRLTQLEDLKQKGKISEMEYMERRAAILGDL